jgi:hypothetical protein
MQYYAIITMQHTYFVALVPCTALYFFSAHLIYQIVNLIGNLAMLMHVASVLFCVFQIALSRLKC